MLQKIRSRSGSWGVRLLLVLIIASFGVFWGMSDMIRDAGSSTLLAKVGNVKISKTALMKEFQDHWQALIGELEAKGAKPEDIQRSLAQNGLRAQALLQFFEEMIQRVLISVEIKRMGLTMPDADLRKIIQNTAIFQNTAGQFDRKVFEQILHHNHLNETLYVEKMRNELVTSNLIASLMGIFRVPNLLADQLETYQRDQRLVRWYVLNDAAVQRARPIHEPKADDIQTYYTQHPEAFTAPESRSFRMIHFSADEMAKSISINDDEAYRTYQSQSEAFRTPEARKVTQLFIAKREDFPLAQEGLAQGLTLQQIAKKAKTSAMHLEQIDWIERGQLPQAVADAIFEAKKGETTRTVHTSNGWYIFHIDDIRAGGQRSFPSVKAEILAALKQEKAKNQARELSEKIADAFIQGANLDEIAQTHKLTIVKVGEMDARGFLVKHHHSGAPSSALPDASQASALAQLVFQTRDGSDIQKIGGEAYAMVHVDKITPQRLIPLMEARAQVIQAWQKEHHQLATAGLMKEIMTHLEHKPDLATLPAAERAAMTAADAQGAALMSHAGLVDNDASTPTPTAIKSMIKQGYQIQQKDLRRVFATPKGQFVSLMLMSRSGGTLPLIGQVIGSRTTRALGKDERKTFEREVNMTVSADVLQAYMQGLRELHKVKIYEDNVKALLESLDETTPEELL